MSATCRSPLVDRGAKAGYAYRAGELEDPEFSEADMNAALERLPDVPAPA